MIEVQESISISYSGVLPESGYVVTRSIALVSIS